MNNVKCIITNVKGKTVLWSLYPELTAEKGLEEFLKCNSNKGDARLVPITELVTEPDSNLLGQVEQLLSYTYVGDVWETGGQIVVSVSGDWKHDHLYTDYLLETAFGLKKCNQITTEEDGSDSYSADHYYEKLL